MNRQPRKAHSAKPKSGARGKTTTSAKTDKPATPAHAPELSSNDGFGPAMREAMGTGNARVQSEVFNQVVSALWRPSQLTEEESTKRMAAALGLLQTIKPADGLEGLLAAQMVATHSAAMECLRRAMIPEQTFESRDLKSSPRGEAAGNLGPSAGGPRQAPRQGTAAGDRQARPCRGGWAGRRWKRPGEPSVSQFERPRGIPGPHRSVR